MSTETMRERFVATTLELLATDPRVAVVLADISSSVFRPSGAAAERVINVGIREQLMVSVAAGLALSGLRPIAHSYAPFVVERPFEQLKVDLSHQDLGAVLVSVGASYDWAAGGRTHESPEDVGLVASLPGWTVFVPGHPIEAERLLRAAVAGAGRYYLRLSEQRNAAAHEVRPGRMSIIRDGRGGTVIAVGPMLDAVLDVCDELDLTVLYATTVRPFDRATVRRTLTAPSVALVEPYLIGTSVADVSAALADVPHRLLGVGVPNVEHRRYGTWLEHNVAHGLDSDGIGRQLRAFFRGQRSS